MVTPRHLSIGFIAVILLAVPASCAGGTKAEGQSAVVGAGKTSGHRWSVNAKVSGSRGGVCLEANAFYRNGNQAPSSSGRCSHPVASRGSLVAAVLKETGGHGASMMVVSGAFERSVDKITAIGAHGRAEPLRLIANLHDHQAGRALRAFKYLAVAVSGLWCAKGLKTYDKNGHVLWSLDQPGLRSELDPFKSVAWKKGCAA
jgi:hypothetical protein